MRILTAPQASVVPEQHASVSQQPLNQVEEEEEQKQYVVQTLTAPYTGVYFPNNAVAQYVDTFAPSAPIFEDDDFRAPFPAQNVITYALDTSAELSSFSSPRVQYPSVPQTTPAAQTHSNSLIQTTIIEANTNSIEPVQKFLAPAAKPSAKPLAALPDRLIHKLEEEDTLFALAISYGVTVESIKMANGIFDNDLDFYRTDHDTVVIPHPTIIPKHTSTVADDQYEEKRKIFAVSLFARAKKVSREEATYYLSLHNFDMRAALIEYEDDIKWEKEQAAKKERKAKELWRKQVMSNPLVQTAIYTFGSCVPVLKEEYDPYGHKELDELD